MPVLCWIWQKQYTCSRFNSVGVFQETDTGDTGSLMSEWISITMRCGAFSMWDFLTTTLTVFHIITHCKAWTQTNQHCLRFIMRRHPLWSKYVTRDGNIMLINKGHLRLWPEPYVIRNILLQKVNIAGEALSFIFICVIYQDGSLLWWKPQPANHLTAIWFQPLSLLPLSFFGKIYTFIFCLSFVFVNLQNKCLAWCLILINTLTLI